MGFLQISKNVLKISIGAASFIGTFFTMFDLTYFLSDPNYNNQEKSTNETWVGISWSVLVNMSLLSLFVLQHSILAITSVKKYIKKNLTDTYRSIYVLTTAAALQVFIRNWQSIPQVSIWRLNLSFAPFFWLYTTIHVFAWIVIYVGNICMDVNELIGVKQIYYSIVNLPDPNSRKSVQLQRLNSHMRHPSFLAFILIFWSIPVMSLDRILLATIFTSYMYIAWNPDHNDYAYQQSQYVRKFHELERVRY